jgi:hypothetical protein
MPCVRLGRSAVRNAMHAGQRPPPAVHPCGSRVQRIASRVDRMAWRVHAIRSRVHWCSSRVLKRRAAVHRGESGVRRQRAEVTGCRRWVPPVALDVRGLMQSGEFVSYPVRRRLPRVRLDGHGVIVSRRGVCLLLPRVRRSLALGTWTLLHVGVGPHSVEHRSHSVNQRCFATNYVAAMRLRHTRE